MLKRIIRAIRDKIISVYNRYGWKAVVGLIVYYLIRDITLYILLPMYAVSQFSSK